MKPPYKITTSILNLVSSISEKLGEVKSAHLNQLPITLRKRNRVKTIQASLEIEGNTLTVEQITDLINHKRVIAPQKDILEVKNAIEVYSRLDEFNVFRLESLGKAHKILMRDLVQNPGQFRQMPVGILKGDHVSHVEPPGSRVYTLLKNLFDYLKNDKDLLLIKSCVFHYEFEFIHPFEDGNGRMGRLWQTLILKEVSPVFEFLPIEAFIKERQQTYYNALGQSDSEGESTAFIEFMLQVIHDSLEDLLKTQNVSLKNSDRISLFREIIKEDFFTRQDYLRHFKNISPATASRDLKDAVVQGWLEKVGDKRLTKYWFRE